jgi:predicted transcriptional regulator/adenylate kinase
MFLKESYLMSKAVLISIHPEHVASILSGMKVFEYRKVMPTQDVSHLVLYSTAPIKKVVAVADVVGRLVGSPSRIWADTAYGSGITRKFYQDYFSGYENAGAFELGNVYELSTPFELSKLTSCKVAPQSFCYLNDRDISLILKKAKPLPCVPSALIFVGGIHGVGKTTICRKAFVPLGYRCMTASSLIAAHGRITDNNKRVDDVPGNQIALIEQLATEKSSHNRLLIDGHFTLLNRQGHIELVDLCVFQNMQPDRLILIKGDTKETVRRLIDRDGRKWSQKLVAAFQTEEEKHARHVSNALGIPLHIFDNTVSFAKLIKSVLERD